MQQEKYLYIVYASKGDGLERGPGFRHYADALRYIGAHWGEASFAVRSPEGRFVSWKRPPVVC